MPGFLVEFPKGRLVEGFLKGSSIKGGLTV